MRYGFLSLVVFGLLSVPVHAAPLELSKGDHICIIGNTLADRMQHHGWLETQIHARFPQHELVFRNLGFSGDELTLRLRSASFGTPDEWLTKCKADVIFAFFGYNESFAGDAGLPKFKSDLEVFIQNTLKQQYNGKSAPKLVLFSPIAHEDHKSPNLPDGKANNERLRSYTSAMMAVAKANNVLCVNLFHPTQELYAKASSPLTINGVHLNESGDKQLATVITQALFETTKNPGDTVPIKKIHSAVLEKNFYWFHRYRTVDGYSIYGGRADLKFVEGQTNRVVMQREMEVLDAMTANRDKKIWAAAQGKSYTVKDDNTPEFIPVQTNKPGAGPGGKHLFLSGEEAISKMTLAKGLQVNLFASEEKFPELANPVQMSFDTKGRLWVAVWPTYPHWKPKEEMNDKILILEDTDGDGRADKCTTFAGDLHCPTGFEFYNGGVLVAQAPDLWFLKDTDGDGKVDVRERVIHGLDSADTHHASNSFVLDPGGALYFQEGTFHHSQVETPYGPPQRLANAGVFRYEPRTQKFDVYISYGFANPHGHVFDKWGQDIVVDGTGSDPYHAALFSGRVDFPNKHTRPPTVYDKWTRPCPGMEYLSSRHFPESMQGNLLVGNVIGYQGILQYKIYDNGASFNGVEQERWLSSSDPNFRPSDLKVGPDGAVYFLDWHNPIIGHMQHNLRDPSRDRTHGRIYRVTYPSRALLKPAKIAGEPIEKVLDLLKEPEDRVRYRTRIELGGRNTEDVMAALKIWIEKLDKNNPEYEHHLLEALWLHQSHNVVNEALLKQLLTTKDYRARAAATRVLCYWWDRVSDALGLLRKLASDDAPRVRLEAVRAASFFKEPEAAEVVFLSSEKPMDQYLKYTHAETLRTLDPYVKKAVAEKQPIRFTTATGINYLVKNVTTDDLLKMTRDRNVAMELLFRKGVRDEVRRECLTTLAKLDSKSEMRVLVDVIRIKDNQEQTDEETLFDLVRLMTGRTPTELKAIHEDLEKLALQAKQPVTRQVGLVALISIDGGAEKTWMLASKTTNSLRDMVNAMPMISDPGLRASLYPKVEPLLNGLPSGLATNNEKGTTGRYVRIELKGRKPLTLAEVEIYSEGKNVARSGKASQKTTAHGGVASRAIDGNKSGAYEDGGQTHTTEDGQDPFWEVDLLSEVPIERINIYNRTDGQWGKRLDRFILTVLDKNRKPVFRKDNNPAPPVKAEFVLGGSPESMVRRAAMLALTSVRGQEEKTFQNLVPFIQKDLDRAAAIRAAQRLPKTAWNKDQAKPILTTLLASIKKIPVNERTSQEALDMLEFADALTGLLPTEEAKKTRAELSELGVRVIRIGTLFEKMAYDKEVLVLKAGKPVEFLFENDDLMPHNLVITQPGAMEEIGQMAEETATQPDAQRRHFVPVSKKILLSSILIQPRESQKLSFTAPKEPGVYPYVCTYPGHWRRMHGALYVVEDLDAYLENPEAYLTKANLPIKDDLLKDRRPRTEWKYEELAPDVEKMKGGRSYANGKQMFTVATCISCHKMEGQGQEFGPDLTQMDPKWKPTDVLKNILEPSHQIHEKYQTWILELNSGKSATGVILEEKDGKLKLIENPLLKAEPLVINIKDIDDRKKSNVSMMPKGLLDKLSKEEILDLVAYILAKGDKKHPLFQGESGYDHHKH